MRRSERGLSMNRLVEQASRRSGGAGLRPALTGRMPVLHHRQDACATSHLRFLVPMRAKIGVRAFDEPERGCVRSTSRSTLEDSNALSGDGCAVAFVEVNDSVELGAFQVLMPD